MAQILEERTIEQPPQPALPADCNSADGRLSTLWPPAADIADPPARLPLAARYALRDAIAYAVETPDGEIGFVAGVRIAPFEYWPEELVVTDADGSSQRVPVSSITTVLPREGRLLLRRAPGGARSALRPQSSWLMPARAWRAAATTGGLLGLGAYVATFVALVLDAGLPWAPARMASGAAGGAASALAWRNGARSWPAAIGLGSFWLPFCAGSILTLVLIFR